MMGRSRIEVDLAAPGAGRYAADLARGGLFLWGEELAIESECEVVLRGGPRPVEVTARVVFAGDDGVGVELEVDAAERSRLAGIARAAPPDEDAPEDSAPEDNAGVLLPEAEPEPEPEARAEREGPPKNVYERLRGLPLVAQYKVARTGELHERIALERIYHKTVWDPLLRNPRITPHEVAHLARMGNLPRPQLELICSNPTWLNVPEVRRAVLSNPRLGVDQIIRVLRMLPRPELKLVPMQTAYPHAVREHARQLLKPLSDRG